MNKDKLEKLSGYAFKFCVLPGVKKLRGMGLTEGTVIAINTLIAAQKYAYLTRCLVNSKGKIENGLKLIELMSFGKSAEIYLSHKPANEMHAGYSLTGDSEDVDEAEKREIPGSAFPKAGAWISRGVISNPAGKGPVQEGRNGTLDKKPTLQCLEETEMGEMQWKGQ
ncbi:hypothetical protein AAES_144099 [Amazona aestiva]|uniref:Uncharacterized protein n=1 Tax=Amazona aestiva TaxID=12930 RepID=A0A0Q3LYF2_AMAAE|nr:hypothetical protein AAES_144099 [Amazona aestiva]